MVHGGVSGGNQGVNFGAVSGVQADANAHPHLHLGLVGQVNDLTGQLDQLGGNGLQIFHAVGIGQDDGKFIAADAGHRVGFAHGLLPAAGHGDQHRVPRIVAVLVVHTFEAVQVQEEQGQRFVGTPRSGQVVRQALEKQRAVGQTGELVMRGLGTHQLVQVVQLFIGLDQPLTADHHGRAHQRQHQHKNG